ncbi:MAG: FAD:protein FMN transferase [Planctomycetales bacterium]|nr:FAD:protein FMN transferase [Planctomycetales bacterium]
MRQVSRRRFFCFMAGVGTSAGVMAALRFGREQADVYASGSELQIVSRRSWALGSDATITILHQDASAGDAAIDAAFKELELIEDVMSLYRANSQLSRLNRDGVLDDPHPYFVEVLHAAQAMARRSDGAFDVTIQPLWNVYTAAQQRKQLPTDAEIAAAKICVDWKKVHIANSQIRLDGRGTAITLNGIAQGFAADRVAIVLREHGVEHALIDTGEIGAIGTKANGDAWRIGIQHPRDREAYVSVAKLAGRCLATSGDYATSFSEDYKQHHLLDPRTGRSPSDLSSVSIAAATALDADALSTAVFVMGADAGLRLVAQTSGADALLVLKDGRSVATTGFPTLDA